VKPVYSQKMVLFYSYYYIHHDQLNFYRHIIHLLLLKCHHHNLEHIFELVMGLLFENIQCHKYTIMIEVDK